VPIRPVERIWMDGQLVPWDDAKVHVLSQAFQYGCGVFEGIRAYATERGPAVFRLGDHLRRLQRSALLYHMDLPYSEVELESAAMDTIVAADLRECYIRMIAFRAYGEMGLNPLSSPVGMTIAVWEWGAYLGEEALEAGVRAKISSWKRNDQSALPPGAKANGQYLNSILAKMEVHHAGYDEAILLNNAGFVADGSGENVFIVKDGALITPPVSAGCLDGITRASIMALARDAGCAVVERNLTRFDLYAADEAFFTGTAAEVTPIREVDDRTVGSGRRGAVTAALQAAFFDAVHGRTDAHVDWITPVGARVA
jgi:branched-chain amino acid aminotransferase